MPSTSAAPILFRAGRIIAYRIFDVGDAIELETAQARLAAQVRRKGLQREGSQALTFAAPPVDTPCGTRRMELPRAKRAVEVRISARCFDYGAVSVRFEIEIEPGTNVETLLPLCDELYDSPLLEEEGRRELGRLLGTLGDAVVGSHRWEELETYTIVLAEKLEGPTCHELRHDPRIARLLLGEASERRLSPSETTDVLKHAHSYFEDDLVIVDWNSALVVEPGGSLDIPDILEFATAQLLELRYYDRLLDVELGRIYERFQRARGGRIARVFRSPYNDLARDVLRRFVELTEFTERVDNSLKIIGDFYLARVYEAALRRFRIPDWRRSIDEKQALVARAYDLFKGEVEIQRSTLLEVIVIILILVEAVAAAWRR